MNEYISWRVSAWSGDARIARPISAAYEYPGLADEYGPGGSVYGRTDASLDGDPYGPGDDTGTL